MPHVKRPNGQAGFLTPTIHLNKEGSKDTVILNTIPGGGSALALGIGYLMEVGAYTTDKDNRLENKTARKNALLVEASLVGVGKDNDTFTYLFPAATEAGEMDTTGKMVKVMSTTRADLVKVINAVKAADVILSASENEVAKLIPQLKEVSIKSLNPAPVYGGESAGRAKRSGSVIRI